VRVCVCVLKEPEACASLCRVSPPPSFLIFSSSPVLLFSFSLSSFSSPLFLSPVKCRQDCLNKVEHRKWYTRSVAISECSLTLRHLTNRIDKSIKCRNIQEPHGWHGIKRFQSQQHDCFLPFFFSNSTSMRIQRELAGIIDPICVCGAQALSSLLCFPPTKYFGYYDDDCLSHHLSPFFLSVSHTHLVLQ
jgi:hypothetical protein